jgi:excisionase family DNA binding protein
MAQKDVLNVEEAAALLGVSPWTIREQARLGRIPGRKVGKEWRFSRPALLSWLGTGGEPANDRGEGRRDGTA